MSWAARVWESIPHRTLHGLHRRRGLQRTLCAAYHTPHTIHAMRCTPHPLWVRTCFGCVNGGPG